LKRTRLERKTGIKRKAPAKARKAGPTGSAPPKTKKRRVKSPERKLDDKLDRAWSLAVRHLAGNKCEMCGKDEVLHAHHLKSRVGRRLRWDIRNGVSLCPKHHMFGSDSAHKDPLGFADFMRSHRPKDVEYVLAVFNETVKWTTEQKEVRLAELKAIVAP
jgi:hypothetical protein